MSTASKYGGDGYFTKFLVGGPACDEKIDLIGSKFFF